MTLDDDEPTAEERQEAERLARALERGHAPSGVPEDALSTAALLRYAKDGGALDPERGKAIFEDAMARARPPREARARTRWTLFGLLGLGAAGALSIAIVLRTAPPDVRGPLPPPPRALLEAQVAALSGPSASLDALAMETAGYRGTLYAKLRERYGR